MPKKPTRKVRKWKTSNGNVCFQFPMRETFERPWIIILVAFLVIIICCVEFWRWNSYTLLTPSMVLFFIFFLWWINIPVRNNEIIVVKTIHEIMDNIVNEDAKAVRRTVIRTLVNHDTKGTYGIVEASCLLVLLDNGEVWEYPIIYHKHNNQDTYFECERAHIVSNNQNHIHRINPQKWKRFINRLKLSEKTCLGLLLTTILVVGFLILVGFYWIMKNYIWQSLLIFAGYLFLYSLIGWIYLKWPVKILNAIRFSMSIPLEILNFLFRAISPFFTIVGTYLFVALFTFGVPAIILTGISRLGWIVLRPETITFIVFTIGSILCSNSYRSGGFFHFTFPWPGGCGSSTKTPKRSHIWPTEIRIPASAKTPIRELCTTPSPRACVRTHAWWTDGISKISLVARSRARVCARVRVRA